MKSLQTAPILALALTLAASAVALDVGRDTDGLENARIFTSAIEMAGLEPEIADGKQFTLFVPSDVALETEGSASLIAGVYATPGNRNRLAGLVAYHIVPGEKLALNVDGERVVATQSGERLDIAVRADEIVLNGQIRVTDTIDLGTGIAYVTSGLLWADLVYEDAGDNIQASVTPIN